MSEVFITTDAAPPAPAINGMTPAQDLPLAPVESSARERTPRALFDRYQLAALALILLTFVMAWVVSDRVFEQLPHLEDEMSYLFQARAIATGDWVIESPPYQRAYWQPFVVDRDGLRFGKYTPGWPLLLTPGVLMGREWVINAFWGALAVALVYRLGRSIFNADTGLIGAALTAFSPAALLLNGSLMGHSAALACGLLCLWAYWQLEKRLNAKTQRREDAKQAYWWGALAGIALGLLVANRALTAIAFAAPLVLYTIVGWARAPRTIGRTLAPLAVMSLLVVVLALLIPAYNQAAVDEPFANLYTLVWPYDRAGFGEGSGRSGHTLEKAVRHTRFDLSLTAADWFGWNLGAIDEEVVQHYRNDGDYFPRLGLSWVLIPFGLIAAFRGKAILVAGWIALGVVGVAVLFGGDGSTARDPRLGWPIVIGLLAMVMLPIALWRGERRRWTWLLIAVALGLLVLQMTYWVGSQRYSTRYYYEGFAAAALLSALPLAWLARRGRWARRMVYAGVAIVTAVGFVTYTTPRLHALNGYNFISRAQVQAIQDRREGDRPVLVIITGTTARWRSFAPLMAQTWPTLDRPIVAAWNYQGGDGELRRHLLERYADRQVIEMQAADNQAWFPTATPAP